MISPHKLGDTRIIKKYALLPNVMDNGQKVWFDHYHILEKYMHWGVLRSSPAGGLDIVERLGWGNLAKAVTREDLSPKQKEDNAKCTCNKCNGRGSNYIPII